MYKFLFFITLLLSVNFVSADTIFTDVSENDYYYEAVNYLKQNQIVQGYQDGSFGVDKSISRAELSKIIILDSTFTLKKPTKCFTDVSFDNWFSSHVCTAKAYGIVGGFSDRSFRPNSPITKAESLKLILLSKKIKDFETDFDASSLNMTKSDWFYDMVGFAKSLDLWFFDDLVSPNELITRAEFSELFFRTANYVSKISEENNVTDSLDQSLDENQSDSTQAADSEDSNLLEIDSEDQNLESQSDEQSLEDSATGIAVVDDQDENIDQQTQNETQQNVSQDSELLSFEFKEYDTNSFDNIDLDNKFSNFYFQNQILNLKGRLDGSEESVLFAILDEDKNTVYSKLFEVESGRFVVDSMLDLNGDYYFALIPGTGGNSKIYPVTISSFDDFNLNLNARDEQNLSFTSNFLNDNTVMQLISDDFSLYEIVFEQNADSFRFFVNSNQEFNWDYKFLDAFVSGDIQVKAAKLDLDFNSLTVSRFNFSDFDPLNAVYHNFSEINEDITNLNKVDFYNINQEVNISFNFDQDFKKDFYLINPDGRVETFKDQVLSVGNTHSLSFTPNLSGTYILEVNDLNGLAIINSPIYLQGSDVVLPDYFDLFDENESQDVVDLNLMLNLINEARLKYGLGTVELNEELNNLSDVHLQDMIVRDFFAHVNLDGLSPQDRAETLGINTLVGENLAKDVNTEKAFYSLMRSAAHRANILNPSWNQVGLAISEHDGYVYVVQEFSYSEDTVLTEFQDLVEDRLDINIVSQNLLDRAGQWSDLMSETQEYSTTINDESIFDSLENSGFSSFLALVGAQSDISQLEANLGQSLDSLSDFAPQAYSLAITFDGDGKFAFTIIVAK